MNEQKLSILCWHSAQKCNVIKARIRQADWNTLLHIMYIMCINAIKSISSESLVNARQWQKDLASWNVQFGGILVSSNYNLFHSLEIKKKCRHSVVYKVWLALLSQ